MKQLFSPILLQDHHAVVTGGNAGIGKAIALALAQYGAKVSILGTNAERGDEAVKEIDTGTGRNCARFYQANVAKTDEIEKVLKEIGETSGPIDILVNNAGITRDQLLMKMTESEWDEVMNINVKSCYNTCHTLVRSFLKGKKGSIINISSVVGLMGNPGQANYAASKAAIIGFTKAVAKEVASRNVRVNCVCPGFIQTRMTDVLTEEQQKNLLQNIPMGKIGVPDDVANMVVFLASDLAAYITGQVFVVDGGLTM